MGSSTRRRETTRATEQGQLRFSRPAAWARGFSLLAFACAAALGGPQAPHVPLQTPSQASSQASSQALSQAPPQTPSKTPPSHSLSGPAAQRPIEKDDELELTSNLVTVTVVVRDASGAIVKDLKPGDFAVFEDGALQDIDAVQRERDVPLRLALLFDASLSVGKRLEFERRAADRFFANVLGPSDEAALYTISTDWRLNQGLTPSAATLAAATSKIRADGITSLFAAVDAASQYLAKSDGRRVIVVLSDGADTGSMIDLKQALASAQRADAVIYAVGSTGDATAAGPLGKLGADTLRALTGDTGGSVFFPSVAADPAREASELDAAYAKVVEELRAQYVLTYYSNRPADDGTYRTLRVEARRPGLRVAARSGYYAR